MERPPIVPGFRVDRYEMLAPIGEGGMATVWVARQEGKRGFEKLVAIKTILPRLAHDPRFQRMFLDEARIASAIEHPNVARILDLGEEHDVLYLVMEWVDGDALSRLQLGAEEAGGALPPAIALRIMADVCAGLHAAHETTDKSGAPLGLVHRDVSPQNVLVATRGTAKLIDFGIAKVRDRAAHETTAGTLKGKVRYMAPEQALGQSIDRRADVWSVGAVLYHLLAGRPPFDAVNEAATLIQLTTGKPPPPLPASVPDPVVDVVCKAMAHEARRRYATALEMRAAIEQAMVDADLPATESDVADYAASHLSTQAVKRRQAIEKAVEAAAERSRAAPPAPAAVADAAAPIGSITRRPSRTPLVAAAIAIAIVALATIAFALRPAPTATVAAPPVVAVPAETATVAPEPPFTAAPEPPPSASAPGPPIATPRTRTPSRSRPHPASTTSPPPSGHRADYGF